ncbi:MAG: MATE family efflux transporter [Bacteroidales bacterium]|nr:MATE family efflux transporter [Bacteroidales bacterium]
MRSLDRQILNIALPAIVSNITTPVLGLVDVAIVGHIGAAAYIGAIAVGSTMFNMLYWLFGFLRMGTAGLTSQAYGSGDRAAQSAALRRSLALSAVGGVLLIALSAVLGRIIIDFIDTDAETAPLALRYFSICIWGAPAVLGMYTLNGWFLGMQNTRVPMLIALLINVLNIALSLVLVFGLGMKIEGVATGTVTAQWVGFSVALAVAFVRFRPVRIALSDLVDSTAIRRLLSVNTDIFLRTLCLVAVTTWFTRAGAGQGVTVLAANALLMQFFMFFSYFSDGFAFAGEALSGKFYGARDHAQLGRCLVVLIEWGAGIALVFTLVYFVAGEWMLGMLTDDGSVVSAAREYLPWAVGIPLCGIAAFIYDGVFVGLTLTRMMLLAMAIAVAVFFVLWFSLAPLLGNHALWLAFVVYLALRGVSMYIFLRIFLQKTK